MPTGKYFVASGESVPGMGSPDYSGLTPAKIQTVSYAIR